MHSYNTIRLRRTCLTSISMYVCRSAKKYWRLSGISARYNPRKLGVKESCLQC